VKKDPDLQKTFLCSSICALDKATRNDIPAQDCQGATLRHGLNAAASCE
jgi:hypothetical protein